MITNEDIAKELGILALQPDTAEGDVMMLREAASRLRGIQPEVYDPRKDFAIAFQNHPDNVEVTVLRVMVALVPKDQFENTTFNVMLAKHPAYSKIVDYALLNPVGGRNVSDECDEQTG
jgi:hypothetical protein